MNTSPYINMHASRYTYVCIHLYIYMFHMCAMCVHFSIDHVLYVCVGCRKGACRKGTISI